MFLANSACRTVGGKNISERNNYGSIIKQFSRIQINKNVSIFLTFTHFLNIEKHVLVLLCSCYEFKDKYTMLNSFYNINIFMPLYVKEF